MGSAKVYKREFCGSDCLAFKTITPKFQSFWHTHQEFELVYIESGHGKLQYGKRQQFYKTGDIFLLGPWVPHEFFENSQYHVSISLLFNHNFIMPGFLDCDMSKNIKRFLDKTAFGILFREKISKHEIDIIQMILEQSGLDRAITLLTLLNRLSTFQHDNLLTHNTNQQVRLKEFAKIQDILSFINKNLHQKLSLNGVAEKFYMSTSHFCRFFQSHTKTTFSQYIISQRIEKACYMLLHTDLSITQISQESGFESISSFNRAFSKLTNITPSKYRNR
ncbi:AraC family transcriptional regulator [Orbus mooreae]|uniref:AraC family transcriptional regulator n=1 Tax=Orbus mooreae TaxID=3074107 RepID=UPI00370D792F